MSWGAIPYRLLKEDLSTIETFEQRAERREGVSMQTSGERAEGMILKSLR